VCVCVCVCVCEREIVSLLEWGKGSQFSVELQNSDSKQHSGKTRKPSSHTDSLQKRLKVSQTNTICTIFAHLLREYYAKNYR